MSNIDNEGSALVIPNHKTWRENGGRMIHDGDCYFWSDKLCTCGLIHHLLFFVGDKIPKWFHEEYGWHARALERLCQLEPLQPLTVEQIAKNRTVIRRFLKTLGLPTVPTDPIAPVPKAKTRWVAAIAAWKLWERLR